MKFQEGNVYGGQGIRNAIHLAFMRPDQIWLHCVDDEELKGYEQNMFDLTNGRSKGTSAIATERDIEEKEKE